VTILGTREVIPPGSWTLRAGEVEVTVGEVIIPGDRPASELASLVREQVRNQGTAPLED
jgi:hypothetical protein